MLVRYALYADGELVETNDPEIKADAKDKLILIKIGEGRVFPKALEEKLKESDSVEMEFKPEESPFGPYDRSLIRAIPTKTLQRTLGRRPKIGESIRFGDAVGRVILVERNQTLVDFNHPLAGKTIKFSVKVVQKIEDDKELIKRLIYQFCDEIKPDEVNVEGEETFVITLPKGRLHCPGVELSVAARLKEREKLRALERRKPLKPERLEGQ